MEEEEEEKRSGKNDSDTMGFLRFSAQVGLPMKLGLAGGLSVSPTFGGLLLGLAFGSALTLGSEMVKSVFDGNSSKNGIRLSNGLFIPDVIIT